MAFNEGQNRGFDSQQVVTWEAKDITLTTTGSFSARFKTVYEGPPVPYPVILDVLFVQVQAEYKQAFGDFYYQPLNEMVPLVAKRSSLHSAKFTASEIFRVPNLIGADGSPLNRVWLELTWVRVYQAPTQLGFHVFPGDALRYYPNIPQIAFDQAYEGIDGRFGYYNILFGRGFFDRNPYNYQRWIRRYLRGT